MAEETYVTQKLQDYFAVSPSGRKIPISRELFDALELVLLGSKPAGQIQIDARSGGIAGVRVTQVLK